ncbi:molybdopterin-guanine dinucleotide biosynthesis protein MobA [Psychrobacter sp. YP14]|uniref:molybdenum cofactor guanylyltransferase n=1 Tax=Psychrobacter sp. YP14 TaxID=2203895 RepID=UPI000D7E342A|nr:NTP transferase domain-containing protein [Psychrobacter sp. YP14]AWT48269.1 molybdopterin-guanine dinucleotide biosynthesis protein MobA [Psychrobacter sp. YP14]
MTDALLRRLDAKPLALAGVVILAGGLSTRMGAPKALLKLPCGDTLLQYHVRSASQLGVPILIADNGQGFATHIQAEHNIFDEHSVANNEGGNKEGGIRHIADYQPSSRSLQANANEKHSAGPLGAILAGMQQLLQDNQTNSRFADIHSHSDAGSQWMLVVSCDSLVNGVDIWQYLTEKKAQSVSSSVDAVNEDNAPPQMYCLADNERDYPLLGLYQLSLLASLKSYLDSGERRVMRFIYPISQSLPMPQAWYTRSNLNTPQQFQLACQQL